ncbi:MAG TPA: type II toxin-antitoxin system RelE/ParE family toxin [Bacteroidota bacterium]|nr:type II toxin-antitoxin system RelE/ParE family toxin [Bacteroidota bacterium]
MPAKVALRYLPAAQEDLLSILEFIANDSPVRASSFVTKLDVRIGRLEEHPLLGRVPRHPKLREYGYRVLIVESYLVFYTIRGSTIEIHRVLHGSRDLDEVI